jgi:hypothetical protein
MLPTLIYYQNRNAFTSTSSARVGNWKSYCLPRSTTLDLLFIYSVSPIKNSVVTIIETNSANPDEMALYEGK